MKRVACQFARIGLFGLGLVSLFATSATAQTIYPKRTTIWEKGLSSDGYTLFIAASKYAVLVDMDGQVINRWVSPFPGHNLSHVDPLANGHILAFSFDPDLPTGRRTIVELDYDGQLVWAYTLPDSFDPTYEMHHDSERLMNGNTLLLMVREILVPSISAIPLLDDFLMEVNPDGKIVWVWHTYQHFNEFGFDEEARMLIRDQGGDWAHANSISVIPPNLHTQPEFRQGNIIVSHRFTNTIFIIDRDTEEIVWKMGPEEDQVTYGQHFPHMIELDVPGAGNILVFDNGSGTGYPLNGRAPGFSSVPEINPVTKDVIWRYNAANSGQFRLRFHSNIVSGAQRLANGNTLICSGVRGRFFEVTLQGEIAWEYMSPFESDTRGTLVYRAYRVPYSWAPAN